MQLYICEICGDGYLGAQKPIQCPFCGAGAQYIKLGKEADPIVNKKLEISEISQKNLKTAFNLEIGAVAIYNCMAEKAKDYWEKAMYKRLVKVELEHASAISKILNSEKPEIGMGECSEIREENFDKTVDLEENASTLYAKFSEEAEEEDIKIFFQALSHVEKDHIDLINSVK